LKQTESFFARAHEHMAKSKHEEWIEDIRNADGVQGGIKLSQWEQEFLENIEGRLAEGRTLTEGQRNKLEDIWNRI
jgi:hypothetical protein